MTTTNTKNKQLDDILNQSHRGQGSRTSSNSNRTQQRATNGANTIAHKLDREARNMATSMKNALGARAIEYLVSDLACGDFGDFFEEEFDSAFANFTQTIDAETLAIESGEKEAFLLPSSPGAFTKDSNSTRQPSKL